jgi:hypothetical protein
MGEWARDLMGLGQLCGKGTEMGTKQALKRLTRMGLCMYVRRRKPSCGLSETSIYDFNAK